MATQQSELETAGALARVAPLDCSAVLTHHWLVRRRGGEKVLEALAALIPDADVFTLIHDRGGYVWGAESSGADDPQLRGRARRIHASWLNWLPCVRHYYPQLLPLLPGAARATRLPPVDLVLCSDASIAKAMRAAPRSRVVCYCHSPMRYVWEAEISAQYGATLPRMLRPLWPALCRRLRAVDREAAQRVDQFVANSAVVAERILRAYGRSSVVVYPPVELPAVASLAPRENYYLCIGHHVAYKRLPLAIAACAQLGARLVVIGGGPDVKKCQSSRTPGVEWLGHQPDHIVREHYRRARALLFPGEEDFGIVPVEAIAHGCPVIALGRGGAVETVTDGLTGALFNEPTVDSLCAAIKRASEMRFDPNTMHARCQRFSLQRFQTEMRVLLAAQLQFDGAGPPRR